MSYRRQTVTDAIEEQVSDPGGSLVRVRTGQYRVRDAYGAPDPGPRSARDHVLVALGVLHAAGSRAVTRREVEEAVRSAGVQYTKRAIGGALTALVHDPGSGVRRVAVGRYGITR